MLNIKNLQLSFGNKILIQDTSVQLYKNQIVGLLGQNGSGKTTLFKLLLGKIHPEAGDFSLTNNTHISYVEQEIHAQDTPLVDYVLSVHPLIVEDHTDLPEYYTLRPKAEKLLLNLGFDFNELYLPLQHFSGGWQMRANLAKALFVPSDLLLLDEPTNHLDIETVMWLEDWLAQYKGLAIVISHDREFLDNISTHILHLSGKTLTLYTGNYTTFEKTRYSKILEQQQQHSKSEAKKAHLQKFINRFSAGTRAKQAQSRMKMLDKLQTTALLPKDVEFNIKFFEPEFNLDKLLSIHEADIGYTNNVLLRQVKLEIFQDSKIGILGKNGVGKSTFIKAMINKSTLLNGFVEINSKIKIGYFAQNTVDSLDPLDTPLSFLAREHKTKREQELRTYLGNFGFVGDKVKDTIGKFSGGEKARLTIANIIYHRPNILFLDEPTNHLDMQMRQELASSLQDFNGAVIIVSHDKFLLESIANEFYLINDHTISPFDGDLDDYHKFLLTNTLDTSDKNKPQTIKKPPVKKNELKIKSDIIKTEQQINRIHAKISTTEKMLKDAISSDSKQQNQIETLTEQYNEAKAKLITLENLWLELNQQLD
jgi:ATP-binding cassette subfamily F protein 3